eukprot:SAG11_NODE_9431_length_911_cov_1.543665_1_plen_47_part_00
MKVVYLAEIYKFHQVCLEKKWIFFKKTVFLKKGEGGLSVSAPVGIS